MICQFLEERFGPRAGRLAGLAWRSALAAGCLWVALGAVRRVTTRATGAPATEADVGACRLDTGRPDVTEALRTTLSYFRNPPVAAEDAILGPWNPANRPELGVIISYLDLPATRQAMEDLERLSAGSLAIPFDEFFDPNAMWHTASTQAAAALRARIRRRWSGDDSPARAWTDAETLMRLARMLQEQPGAQAAIIGLSMEIDLRQDIHCLLMEQPPPRDVRRRIAAAWDAPEFPPPAFARVFQAEAAVVIKQLSGQYLTDAQGGSLDLTRIGLGPKYGMKAGQELSVLCNVGSLFFDDRHSVERSVRAYVEQCIEALHEEPSLGASNVARAQWSWWQLRISALPTCDKCGNWEALYQQIARLECARRAIPIVLALADLHDKSNAYPASVQQLIPGFLQVLPKDPYANVHLSYTTAAGGYTLYSLGPDGCDDNLSRMMGADDITVAGPRAPLVSPKTVVPGMVWNASALTWQPTSASQPASRPVPAAEAVP